MALRHRDIVPTLPDRENITAKAGKSHLIKPIVVTKRPPLDELSNKLLDSKKPDPAKEAKEAPKPVQPAKKDNPPVNKAFSSSQLPTALENDSETCTDPQMVSEYQGDIFKYLHEMELKYPIRANFLENHKSTSRMRAILVNWLIRVHENFGLCLETLHMCISLIDRYLQDNTQVGRESLQLVGTSALLIACKYEEMYYPGLQDFKYICDNTFSTDEILKMEISILTALQYNLGKPLSIHFLRRYSKLADVKFEQHNLSKYLLELALLDHDMSHIRPSLQAAAACCLSIAIFSNATCPSKVWTGRLAQYSNCKYSEFKHVVVKFAKLLIATESSKHKSVQEKYADTKFNKVSLNPKLKGFLVKRLAETSLKV
ncbi:hypothetical protein Zmor_020082 [Zophobas morio]|uniref:Uncharacterized protein n=1 Tax=Zophobas morio TaxID=2755281 RepID=A0AA38I0X1_9CUCU|nr:hypothetical protein Zmor_020082 [Zophobas morio]